MKTQKYYGLFDIILPYIRDKKVLDVGCVDHELKKKDSSLWVHGFLKKYCDVVGIDILKDEIDSLRKEGYNVYCKNAEDFHFDSKFDVILAGELIEHLSNQGLFLRNCKKYLNKDGLLILSTPHSFNIREMFLNLFFLRDNPLVNPEHTCYYTPRTINQLLNREGFRVVKFNYFDFYGSFLGKIRYSLFDLLGKKFKRRMVVIAKLK
jgi:SAM-dependent methyltransferase